MVPVKHALAGLLAVDLEGFHQEPFIMCSRQPQAGFSETVLDLWRTNGFAPQVAHDTSLTAAMAELVAAGLRAALRPQPTAGGGTGRRAATAGDRYDPARGSHDPRAAPLYESRGQSDTASGAVSADRGDGRRLIVRPLGFPSPRLGYVGNKMAGRSLQPRVPHAPDGRKRSSGINLRLFF